VGEKGILNAKFINQQIIITESLVLNKQERNIESYMETLTLQVFRT
jgi:hypothetical protein